jgi:hypothetical protein
MERRYFFITIPNENMVHALDVFLGVNVNPRYNIAKDVVGIKTTQDLIDAKVNSGVGINTIFPSGLTTEVTEEVYKSTMEGDDWQDNNII